jgi:5-methylcytosine-specific restriction endonuclease McrA
VASLKALTDVYTNASINLGLQDHDCEQSQHRARLPIAQQQHANAAKRGQMRNKGEKSAYLRDRRYRRELRHRAIQKMGGKCMHCGFDDERALVFDHIKPVRRGLRGVAKSKQTGQDTHRAVLHGQAKAYQLLCANCHMIKSRQDDRDGRMSVNWSRSPLLRDRLRKAHEGELEPSPDPNQLSLL